MKNKLGLFLSLLSGYSLANCNNIDAKVTAFMQKNQVPGVAIAIVNDKKVQFCNYGIANLATHTKVTEKTIFETASITKTFTALAAAVSQENKMFELNAPITDYVSELPQNSNFKNVTSQELLAHVSGMPAKLEDDTSDDAAFVVALGKVSLQNPPHYQYSNPGISLVGLALENFYFTDYQRVLNKLFLHKLSMKYTFVDIPKKYQSLMATAYSAANQPVPLMDFGALIPGGGLKSNTNDLAKYLAVQINGSRNKKLNKALTIVHDNYYCRDDGVVEQLTWEYHPMSDLNVGLAADRDTLDPHNILTSCTPPATGFIDKTGTTYGMSSYIAYLPQQKVGIVILSNKGQVADRVYLGREILSSYTK